MVSLYSFTQVISICNGCSSRYHLSVVIKVNMRKYGMTKIFLCIHRQVQLWSLVLNASTKVTENSNCWLLCKSKTPIWFKGHSFSLVSSLQAQVYMKEPFPRHIYTPVHSFLWRLKGGYGVFVVGARIFSIPAYTVAGGPSPHSIFQYYVTINSGGALK